MLPDKLFRNNRAWSESIKARDPDFFDRSSLKQSPDFLWIGCSDSRVPATQILGLMPGELLVHRNIANVVAEEDLNCMSVVRYAIDELGIWHPIVCGHYRCGGIRASLKQERSGPIDDWLIYIRKIAEKHRSLLSAIRDDSRRWDRLCELNVIEQVMNLFRSSAVQNAWAGGRELSLHGLIYGLNDGLLRDPHISIASLRDARSAYDSALKNLS